MKVVGGGAEERPFLVCEIFPLSAAIPPPLISSPPHPLIILISTRSVLSRSFGIATLDIRDEVNETRFSVGGKISSVKLDLFSKKKGKEKKWSEM